MTTSRTIARRRSCAPASAPDGPRDPFPRRGVTVGLGVGLLAAAVSLSGCTGAAGAGGPRNGTADAAVVPPSLPSNASLVATAAVPDAVPAPLAGRTWVVRNANGRAIAGSLGSGRRLRLPVDERPLTASNGLVASVVASGSGSSVVVRAIDDGRQLVRVERQEEVLAATFAGDALLLGGHMPGLSGRDPGVVAVSLSDGSASALIAAADVPATVGTDLVRTVAVSPSGRTLVSGLCGPEDCAIDVVDLSSRAVRRLVSSGDGFPGVVTDEVVVIGSADSDWIAGLDLATGERRWTRDGAEFQHAYATLDGRVVQALVDRTATPTFRLEVLDAATGRGREVLSRDATDGMTLWPERSDGSFAVVSAGATFADAANAGPAVHAASVDLASGALDPNGLGLDLGADAP